MYLWLECQTIFCILKNFPFENSINVIWGRKKYFTSGSFFSTSSIIFKNIFVQDTFKNVRGKLLYPVLGT